MLEDNLQLSVKLLEVCLPVSDNDEAMDDVKTQFLKQRLELGNLVQLYTCLYSCALQR